MSNSGALSTSAILPAASERRSRRLQRGLPDLWHFAAEYMVLPPIGVLVALVWANTAAESYFRTMFALEFFVVEVAMVVFFGFITKEVVEATAPGGVLHSWRRLALPVVAAAGLTLVAAVLQTMLAPAFGEPHVANGWPAALGTDIAFAYFVAIVIFGRHAVVPFVLMVALAANVFGFLVLAPAATAPQAQYPVLFGLMAAAVGSAAVLRWRRTRRLWPYLAISGTLSWLALLLGGMHAALALVPIVPFLPHAPRDPGFFVDAPPDAPDTLNAFERWCRHPAQVALLLFGFVVGGVQLRGVEWGALSLPLAMIVGKPLGLFAGVGIALGLGLHLPFHVGWRHLVVVGFIAAIGCTMSLFFATVAVGPGVVRSALKMGALATTFAALLAFAAARLLRVGRFAS